MEYVPHCPTVCVVTVTPSSSSRYHESFQPSGVSAWETDSGDRMVCLSDGLRLMLCFFVLSLSLSLCFRSWKRWLFLHIGTALHRSTQNSCKYVIKGLKSIGIIEMTGPLQTELNLTPTVSCLIPTLEMMHTSVMILFDLIVTL